MKAVCVFCGSRDGADPEFIRQARRTGRRLAELGLTIVYGGGGRGMMGAVADGALDVGGAVIGVLPRNLFRQEHLHAGLTEVRAVDSMLERKSLMAELSDAFISLPGGIGTMDELFEMWTWTQLGIHGKPSGLLDVNGYFAHLIGFLDHMTEVGYLSAEQRGILVVEDALEPLLARLGIAH